MADNSTMKAVERAIDLMHTNLGDHITIDDLARAAMFSKFHFSRLFQRVTGVSPARFLSAMRIDEAKRLLLTTPRTVADIGHHVGYNSVGTFSSRFRSSVGVSPITYRQLDGVVSRIPDRRGLADGRYTDVRGRIHGRLPGPHSGVFVGAFPSRVPEGAPARYAILAEPGPFHLPEVPIGTWYLIAHVVTSTPDFELRLVGCHGPFTVHAGTTAHLVDLQLRQSRRIDPPVLLALPDLRTDVRFELAG
ncbi:MAG TPA: AraC family transcriptional regulator [Pseudonocardiaceae bacterium]|jgi:AraC-like DNA-binding protein|nr:AraC family transcriptional regulator [Pseudonocardiaceae bacterium]